MAPSSLFQYLGLGGSARTEEPPKAAPGRDPTCRNILRVGDTSFLLEPESRATIPVVDGPDRYIPATVVYRQEGKFGDEELEQLVTDLEKRDDVWNPDFLQVVVLVAPSSVKSNNEFKRGTKVVRPNHQLDIDAVPSGPYMLHSTSGFIYQVFRLYSDDSNAFVGSTAPQTKPEDDYSWLDGVNHVAVPSRLYRPEPTKERPLEGMRFAVKDVIDVAGLPTGCGSKCWREFYPAAKQSAPFIDQLVAGGAVLVGKLRCCQLGDAQDPSERFEEVTPTNPRGDGFQVPGSTSSGSAAAIASYSWLDFSVGTDNGDSRQHPAGLNGVYSLRPSVDSIKSKGVFSSSLLESTSIFSRSATLSEAVLGCASHNVTAAGKGKLGNFKFKLLYAVEPRDWSTADSDPGFFVPIPKSQEKRLGGASALFEAFIKKLEKQLDCKRQTLCLYDLWRDTKSATMPHDLSASTADASRAIIYRDLSRDVVEPFINEYRAAHENQMPFIEPVTKERLRFGACVSDDQYNTAREHLDVYAKWVNTVLLPSPAEPVDGGGDGEEHTKKQSPEIPILVCPQHWGTPAYRDEATSRGTHSGLAASSIAACSGVSLSIFPVGEVPFVSKITETEGLLPVSVSMLAPKGLDGVLVEIVAELERAGELKTLKTGSRAF